MLQNINSFMLLIITVYTKPLVFNTYPKLTVSIQQHAADAAQLSVVAVVLENKGD